MPMLVCPICQRRVRYHRPADIPHRPFCSRRCELVDLAHWLDGRYRIAGPPADPSTPEPPGRSEPPAGQSQPG